MTRSFGPRAAMVVALFLGGVSCAPVAAYHRGRLAHSTMSPDFGSSEARDHLVAVHEGAIGGQLGASSGCGCN